ncbi:3D-(3,5/4)-trihydroxycyclohexane-1,2-dione acylhydrolase (decyclizing) [Dactylosporangium sucinum]|uniref:3D-(3,5/4)-trihydroxycyclohexane-1,2-dione acylhydrolase (Decyclizing) n=1 Tax=Dactylosporangium sucinum TaxID=1424081 RepID=A0A917TU47_9ACTN|nr:3D-(3,5/4)-trihydroxycyclohexane-1,2-dione acylhydrolase (decyclizing) [Dactylosporangium sucinum]GGM36331.1 3D-(3,5/4)-trihydroxycyclohexane-1,2-dione acylhydrolase (decyclizing) [Dactylosporangium sucinum]
MTDQPAGTVRLTVAQAIVRFLAVQYTERDGVRRRAVPGVFGIFGHGNAVGLGHALSERRAELPFLQPKNEQSMVHAAIGYAKAVGRTATYACTASIGPGATNLVTGAATATVNRLPVLLLPADTFANRRQGPVLQQLEHAHTDVTVNDCLRPVSRLFDRISRPEQLLTALPAAMRVLFDPAETGAVTLALPQDVQGEAFDFPAALFRERTWRVPRRPPEAADVAHAAGLLRASARPLIVAGGGVRYSAAETAVAALSERYGIPVAETSAALGSVAGSRWHLGGIGVNGTAAANAAARAADLVVHVGTRLTDFTTGSHSLFADPEVRFVGVNVVAEDAHKLGAYAVVADARATVDALAGALSGWTAPPAWSDDAARCAADWRDRVDEATVLGSGEALTQGGVLTALNRAAQPGDWVVAAAGGPPGDLLKTWRVRDGVHTHVEFGYSCMGHELPAALGIRLARPDAGQVYAIIGDGTYLMANTELVTAVQERLGVTVVLLDNGGYQSIHGLQSRAIGTGFGNEFRMRDGDSLTGPPLVVDYAANAASLGARAFVATDAGAFGDLLKQARSLAGPVVIVCPVAPERALPAGDAFWDLGVPEVADDPGVSSAAAAVRAGRDQQRQHL